MSTTKTTTAIPSAPTSRTLIQRLVMSDRKQRRNKAEALARSNKHDGDHQHFTSRFALSSQNSDATLMLLPFDSDSSMELSPEESCSQHTHHRSVSFGSVSVRVHGRVLITEHPECTDGIALGIDWKHAKHDSTMDINKYEQNKERRREKTEFRKLSTLEKKKILTKVCGYHEKDLWRTMQ